MTYPKVYVSDIKLNEFEILSGIEIDGVGIKINISKLEELKSTLKQFSVEKIFITQVADFKLIEALMDTLGKEITLQIQDTSLSINTLALIKKHFENIKIIAPVNVNFEDALDKATKLDKIVDCIFVCAQHKEKSKLIENWQKAAIINLKTQKPIILAGSLNADNIHQAIKIVKPFAVSVISGVKNDGNVSCNKLINFLKNTKRKEA
ncbi:hypothetical protein [Desulfurella sp.]|uniref:phosphoribosylanthranilate isomerase n=1 Tax=Desulfurella sp. TaxID=1962857 RepID=UPI003D115339